MVCTTCLPKPRAAPNVRVPERQGCQGDVLGLNWVSRCEIDGQAKVASSQEVEDIL